MGFPDWESIGPLYAELLVEILVFVVSFVGLAIVCDDHMVKSLETLCVRWGVREDVAGASFMAFGSAAPEIIINAVSTFMSQVNDNPRSTELGLGAIIGSGLIAFLVIPAACGIFAKEDLELKRRPLLRDTAFYLIALTTLVLSFQDGVITKLEGGILICVYVVYIITVLISAPIRKQYHRMMSKPLKKSRSFVIEQREQTRTQWLLDTRLDTAIQSSSDPFSQPEPATNIDRIQKVLNFLVSLVTEPLRFMFEWTCPACGEGEVFERFYAVTFLVSFIWVAFFSFLIASVVERWGELSGLPFSFFGLFIVAVGAEIPDTIQSVTVSVRGYGSMAVSGCLGSQIVNMCIGLGLPWLASASAGNLVKIPQHKDIQVAVYFQCAAVAVNIFLLLGLALIFQTSKAKLTPFKGHIMLVVYVLLVCGYCTYLFA